MLSYSINDTYRPDENERGSSAGNSIGIGRKKRDVFESRLWSDGSKGEEEDDEEDAVLRTAAVPRDVGIAGSGAEASLSGDTASAAGGLRDDSTSLLMARRFVFMRYQAVEDGRFKS